MIWIDTALKSAALASTIIATLRAGSRMAYLLEHDAIGVMEGPVIRNTNESYPLFELSEAFRHCVRLSIVPDQYENVQTTRQPVVADVEPYPLSPRPYISHVDKEVKKTNDTTTSTKNRPRLEDNQTRHSFWKQQFNYVASALPTFPSSISNTRRLIAKAPHVASFLGGKFWNRRRDSREKSQIDDEDWDWHWSTEAQLRFNATIQSKNCTLEDVPRVAELSVFAPKTFECLRTRMFGISKDEYQRSIFGSGPLVSFQSNSKGAARVGGVFFFTRDGAYMIKTIKTEEAETFLTMLPKYHKHMERHARSSLLTRFCGMYGVRIYDEGSMDHGQLHIFVVMNAVFPAEASRFISERFDLKGSTVGREVSKEELRKKGSNAVLKDLDLAREVQAVKSKERGATTANAYGLSIGPRAKSALISQLREDVKLLVDCQVMDYSLLVGVVDMGSFLHFDRSDRRALGSLKQVGRQYATNKNFEQRALWAVGAPLRLLYAPPAFMAKQAWSLAHKALGSVITLPLPYYGSGECVVDGGLLSVFHGTRKGGQALYYMGLIDFLQPWTTRKVVERQLKGLMGYDTKAISCVTPDEYAERFLNFLDIHIS